MFLLFLTSKKKKGKEMGQKVSKKFVFLFGRKKKPSAKSLDAKFLEFLIKKFYCTPKQKELNVLLNKHLYFLLWYKK